MSEITFRFSVFSAVIVIFPSLFIVACNPAAFIFASTCETVSVEDIATDIPFEKFIVPSFCPQNGASAKSLVSTEPVIVELEASP